MNQALRKPARVNVDNILLAHMQKSHKDLADTR